LERLKTAAPAALPHLERGLVAFFLFALPLVIYLGNTEYGYTKAIFALFMISLLLVLHGVRALLGQERSLYLTPLFLPGVGLLFTGALSMASATALGISLQSLNLLFYFFLLYLLVSNLTLDERHLQLFLGSILGGAFLAAVYGILQYHGLLPGTPGVPRGTGAIISSLGNRNYLGGFLVYLFWPGLIPLLRGRGWPLRLFALVCLGTIAYTLMLIRSTGAWVALFASGAFLAGGFLYFRLPRALKLKRGRGWLTLGGAVLLLGGGVLTGALTPPPPLSEPVPAPVPMADPPAAPAPVPGPGHEYPHLQGAGLPIIDQLVELWRRNAGRVRAWDWWVGWEMLKDHPILGIGLGHYKVRFLEYKAKFLKTPRGKHYDFYILRAAQAHNEYVQWAAETGLLGCLAGGFALFGILAAGARRLRRLERPGERFIALALSAGIAAVLIHALVSFPFHLPASALSFILLLGLLNSRYLAGRASELGPSSGATPTSTSTSSTSKRDKLELGRLLRSGPWVSLGRRAACGLLVGALLLGVGVTVLAWRDFLADTYLDRGERALKLGQLELARVYLERSLALDFQPTSVLYWLGSIYHELGERKGDPELLQRSIDLLERSLLSFQVEPTYLQLASLYAKQGEYERALERLRELLAMSPHPERRLQARYLWALIERDRGNLEAALTELNELLADQPNFERAYLTRARIYLSRGELGLARLDLERALELVRGKLKRARGRLATLKEQGRLTLDEFARLRSEIDQLTSEEELIEELLGKLP